MIVLARMEMTGRRDTGQFERRGVNYYPVFEQACEPHALMFANKEFPGDRKRAELLAANEGYQVIIYPPGTRKPLEKAKAYIAKTSKGRCK